MQKPFLNITDEFGSFDTFIWSYVDNKPIQPNRTSLVDIPNYTPLAEHISKELKKAENSIKKDFSNTLFRSFENL